jgi:exodeoxyribonuclease V alpha subunit
MASRYEVRVTSVYPSYVNGLVEYHKFIGVITSGLSKQATGRTIVEVTDSESVPFPVSPAQGQIWRVRGSVEKSKISRNGWEQTKLKVRPSRLKLLAPSGDAWVVLIEKNVQGIGAATALAIWSEVVVSRSDNLFQLLKDMDYNYFQTNKFNGKSLSYAQVDNLICFWKTYAHVDLIEWLIDKQLPVEIARKFAMHYENYTIDIIENDPYSLITFDNDFSRIDSIARNTFDVSLDDPRRLNAAVYNSIQQHITTGGHTYATREEIEKNIRPLLIDELLVKKAIDNSHDSNIFRHNTKTGTYHPFGLLAMEMVVAERIVNLSKRKRNLDQSFYNSLADSQKKLGFQLSDEQRQSVESCYENCFSIVTGGAGVGKTAVSKAIVETLMGSGEGVILSALSGRAVIRLREATGLDSAKTIASIERDTALHDAVNNAGELFKSIGRYTLLIDEASMVDLPTLWRLFTCFSERLSIIFVGDPQQLPPIGAGLLLHTLVNIEKLSVSKLTIPQRFGKDTGIAEYSQTIGRGILPKLLTYKNVHYHNSENTKQAIEQAIEMYIKAPDSSQLIAATNDEIIKINEKCQAALNPDGDKLYVVFGDTVYSTDFKLNDPIIFTKNLWQYNIQNGKFGRITKVENVCRSENGKLVAISSGDSDMIFGTIEMEDGLSVDITTEIISHFMLSHCISAHKAQGSQFENVLTILNKIPMVDRDWIYTTITRAKNSVVIFDPNNIFRKRVYDLSNASKRRTYLAELIQGELDGDNVFDYEKYVDVLEQKSINVAPIRKPVDSV